MKAFPAISKEPMDDGEGCWFTPSSEGMDLRDYFAAKAMQAIITNSDQQSIVIGEVDNWVGDYAYDVADAMMEARERKNDI
jgi:hypothetical protein